MEKLLSEKYLRRRKFLLFLPVLAIPFIVLLFWLLGGGKSMVIVATKTGLNNQLPDANLKKGSPLDKLSFYQAADADSVKRAGWLRMDPNYKDTEAAFKLPEYKNQSALSFRSVSGNDPRLESKLALLQKQLNETASDKRYQSSSLIPERDPLEGITLKRQADPQMEAINGALEKLLDIQHPERLREKSALKKGQVLSVSTLPVEEDNSFMGRRDTAKVSRGFYDESNNATAVTEANAIKAVVQGTQVLQNGSRIKLRLVNEIYVGGMRVPAGNFVYGIVSIESDRMSIHIPSIQYEGNVFPVSLSVYYLDGLPGIYVPGSATRDVAKQAADNSLQSIGILSMDQSLKGQATAAGISAAKSLFSRKVKQVNVTAKAGDKVLLKDDKESNQ